MSKNDNAFFIGIILDDIRKTETREINDLWNTKQFIWEKVYKVLVHGTIKQISYYHIKGRLE